MKHLISLSLCVIFLMTFLVPIQAQDTLLINEMHENGNKKVRGIMIDSLNHLLIYLLVPEWR